MRSHTVVVSSSPFALRQCFKDNHECVPDFVGFLEANVSVELLTEYRFELNNKRFGKAAGDNNVFVHARRV